MRMRRRDVLMVAREGGLEKGVKFGCGCVLVGLAALGLAVLAVLFLPKP